MRPLVIVRPEPGASATAKAAAAMGLHPIVLPLFVVRPLTWNAPEPAGYDGLLLTSANAVRHGGAELEKLKGLIAYCVGEATASCAREAGFNIAAIGRAGVDDLLSGLPQDIALLHLSGKERKVASNAVQSIDAVPVYESVELPRGLESIRGSVVALHSPRAGHVLAQRYFGSRRGIAVAAISAEAAAAAGEGWDDVEAAGEPTDAALLAIAARLCNTCR